MIIIYTDGSTRGNGTDNSIGGHAAVVVSSDGIIKIEKENNISNTTNNREELKAIIKAINLALFTFTEENVIIYSDSAYCVNMVNDWMWTWFKNGWKRSGNKNIENLDLVQEIFKLYNRNFVVNFSVEKCKGHAEILGNEIADAAATGDENKLKRLLGGKYESFK